MGNGMLLEKLQVMGVNIGRDSGSAGFIRYAAREATC
eukprot:CAMPEP_0198326514 /NCGR_PEP_ID=MMETSP1450-20131203/14027_1 /TAXON_ID=753684 ORGANISM="Madagascaria erythrocladiodes, Strain CCMP3234" /NCGR_SAMPLE_ID=MMETSP1450 /ASSEMBLY_ACC=CAM_ASM_001115 /LENGTH=36 /DNA_ID= /DNA_START= /DNA_END= /DNA_ORIENTATION=